MTGVPRVRRCAGRSRPRPTAGRTGRDPFQPRWRLLLNGWVDAEWAASENNRRARYYTLTADGRRHLAAERASYRRVTAAIDRVLQTA